MRTMMELMKRYVASQFVGKQEEMKIRFEALLSCEKKRNKWMRSVVPVLLVAIFAASYFVIIQPERLPSEEALLNYSDGNIEFTFYLDNYDDGDKFILFQNGEYELYLTGQYVGCIDAELLDDPDFNTIPIYGGD